MIRLVVIAALFCLVVPAALAAPPAGKGKPESSQAGDKNPAKACKAERGTTDQSFAAFKVKYGTNANKANAFGKCVSKKAKKNREVEAEHEDEAEAEHEADENAAKKCKAERTRIGIEAFKIKYGTNANKANAFGKCVSKLAKQQGSSS